MLKADDLGGYYRVPSDSRDLNYAQYFEEGDKVLTAETDYTSENTERLDVPMMVDLLMKLDFIRDELA